MKTTNTIVLLLIAAAVVAAVIFQKRKTETEFSSAAIPEKTIPAMTSGTLERIIIHPPGKPAITLSQRDGKWYTSVDKKYEADEAAVTTAINAVGNPIQASVVSTNPDSFEEYQLTDTTATKVQMFNRGDIRPALSLLIGKDGPSAFSTYVRIPDTQEVLNAKASLSMAFKRPDGWRKREIFSFPATNATQVSNSGTSGTYTLAHSGDKWRMTSPQQGEADEAKVMGIVNMLSSLRAGDFVDPTSTQTLASLGLEPPRQTVHVQYDDKTTSPSKPTTATLLVGNQVPGKEDWYAKRQDKPDVITIGRYVAEALTPEMDSLKTAAPTPIEQTTATAEQIAPAEQTTATAEQIAPAEQTTVTAEETTAPAAPQAAAEKETSATK